MNARILLVVALIFVVASTAFASRRVRRRNQCQRLLRNPRHRQSACARHCFTKADGGYCYRCFERKNFKAAIACMFCRTQHLCTRSKFY